MNYKIIKNKTFLKRESEPVTLEEGTLIGKHLIKALKKHGGVGLSAPQIGILKNVCAINAHKDVEPIILINPRVVESSQDKILYFEGCMSLPKANYTVRNKSITVTADNLAEPLVCAPSIQRTDEEYRMGVHLSVEDKGLLEAVVVQHEMDHLDGILITDVSRKVILNPPAKRGRKFGRNEKVMVKNPKTEESQYIKYKNSEELVAAGWEII